VHFRIAHRSSQFHFLRQCVKSPVPLLQAQIFLESQSTMEVVISVFLAIVSLILRVSLPFGILGWVEK
jgi:hypothetical protein